MKYYSISFRTDTENHRAGEKLYSSAAPVTIGQLPSADIVLDCDDDTMPLNICTIIADGTGGRWLLVKRTDFHQVTVNGGDIHYARVLKDGDMLAIGKYRFTINLHDDDKYIPGQGIVVVRSKLSNKHLALWYLSLILVVGAGIGYRMLHFTRNNFTRNDELAIESSVHKIEVSDIILQIHTPEDPDGIYRNYDIFELDSVCVGTCFLTEDSLYVTARHCVEPWLDFRGWPDKVTFDKLPKYVQWLIKAEESRLEQADTLYRVASRCRIIDNGSCIHEFTSDECSIDRSRDILVHMGDERLPWRIIYPLFERKDVELGDFAYKKADMAGALKLADFTFISGLHGDDKGAKRLYGFPRKNYGNEWEYQNIDRIVVLQPEDGHFKRNLQLKVEGTLGYSGGPVIIKKDGQTLVVGIFSKKDDYDDSHSTSYAVPVTEITNHKKGGQNERAQYRR